MDQEKLSRIAFFGLCILLLLVRSFFAIKLRKESGKKPKDRDAIAREGKTNFIFRRLIILPALAISIFLYSIHPPWMAALSIPFPRLGMWIGAILGLCGIAFLIWVHACLGKEWSVNLQLNNDHRLIQSGPYSRIRHPMYTALFSIYLGLGFISSNYVIIILMIMAVISLVIRIPKEEIMLIEKFGDEYKRWFQQSNAAHFRSKDFTGCSVSEATTRTFV
jgi:protein-S-isoprenylcysteine O-methyltransferase Ste14